MNEKTSSRKTTFALVISLLITLSIGVVAGIFTEPGVKTWYIYLYKPPFNPPNWVFAPVWTLLYILIGISAWMVWRQREKRSAFIAARNAYIVQLLLNFSWSIVFFGMHRIFSALVIIGCLELAIIVNMIRFSRIDTKAAWLLFPYLLWVSFAGLLNASIYILNR